MKQPLRRNTIVEEKEHRAAEQAYWKRQICISKWLNRITAVAAAVGFGGLIILYGTLNEAKRATIESNRAWVFPAAPFFTQDAIDGQPIKVQLDFDNIGHQPATDLKQSTFFDEIKWPPNGDFSKTALVPQTACQDFPPEEPLGLIAPTPRKESFNFINTESDREHIFWKDDFLHDRSILRLRGCLSYLTFGEPHFTWFCYLFVPHAGNNALRRLGAVCRGGSGAN